MPVFCTIFKAKPLICLNFNHATMVYFLPESLPPICSVCVLYYTALPLDLKNSSIMTYRIVFKCIVSSISVGKKSVARKRLQVQKNV